MGNEIEIKFRLTEEQFMAVEDILRVTSGLHERQKQTWWKRTIDRYFNVGDRPWTLRIREEDHGRPPAPLKATVTRREAKLTLKSRKKAFQMPADGISVRQEFEPLLRVDEIDQWLQILEALGFPEYAKVDKFRAEFELGGATICLDRVKDQGTFVEVEVISDDLAQAKIIIQKVCVQLGLAGVQPETRGYLDMALGEGL